jgi:hypothetical protein
VNLGYIAKLGTTSAVPSAGLVLRNAPLAATAILVRRVLALKIKPIHVF